MQRSVKQVRVGQTRMRHVVIYTGEPCPDSGLESRFRQMELLQTLIQQPELTNCGPAPFQKLRMYYGGGEWVVEMEAEVDVQGGV